MTLSLGVVALEDVRDVKAETLVRVADAALYRAKIAGTEPRGVGYRPRR